MIGVEYDQGSNRVAETCALGETLNLVEAAAYLKIGLNTARRLFVGGEIPGLSLNQKHVVFLKSDLAAFIHEQAIRQSAERRGTQPTHDLPESPPVGRRKVPPALEPYEALLLKPTAKIRPVLKNRPF